MPTLSELITALSELITGWEPGWPGAGSEPEI